MTVPTRPFRRGEPSACKSVLAPGLACAQQHVASGLLLEAETRTYVGCGDPRADSERWWERIRGRSCAGSSRTSAFPPRPRPSLRPARRPSSNSSSQSSRGVRRLTAPLCRPRWCWSGSSSTGGSKPRLHRPPYLIPGVRGTPRKTPPKVRPRLPTVQRTADRLAAGGPPRRSCAWTDYPPRMAMP